MKKSQNWWRLAVSLLWLALIYFQSALPAPTSQAESGGILAVVQTVFPWMTNLLLRKIAHFTEYAVLGALFASFFARARNPILLKPLAFGAFAALGDETLQLFVPGRSGQLSDVWLDMAGVACGALLVWLIRKIRKH